MYCVTDVDSLLSYDSATAPVECDRFFYLLHLFARHVDTYARGLNHNYPVLIHSHGGARSIPVFPPTPTRDRRMMATSDAH